MSKVVTQLDTATELEDVILATPSAVRFRKLADKHGLLIHVQGTRFIVDATYYLSKSATHNIGDIQQPEHEARMFSITLTNTYDFAAQAYWYERFPRGRDGSPKPSVFEFDHAYVGGRLARHMPNQPFTQSTKAFEEVNACLSN